MNNANDSNCCIKLSGNFQILYLGAILGLIVLNVNIMIIVTIVRTERLHTNKNIYILSVALLDIFMAVTDFSQGIVCSISINKKMHTIDIIDTVILGTGCSTIILSCTHMAIIAVDRYINITYPFYYILNITKRRLIVLLLIAWSFALVIFSVTVIFYRDEKYHRHCITSHPPWEYFILIASLNVIEYVIIFVCYFKISCLAFRHKKAANARRLQNDNTENVFKLRNNRTAAMKSVKFFFCLFGTFFIFTFPQLLTTGMVLLSFNVSEKIVLGVGNLYDVHSVMNCVIYFHFNKDFSDGVKTLLSDLISLCRRPSGDFNG